MTTKEKLAQLRDRYIAETEEAVKQSKEEKGQ